MTPDHPVGADARERLGHQSVPASVTMAPDTGADWTPLDQRTAHLARALYADLDYVLGVDPNTLAAFCVRVLDEWDNRVHNHGPDNFFSPGVDCPEHIVNGRLRGACMDAAP